MKFQEFKIRSLDMLNWAENEIDKLNVLDYEFIPQGPFSTACPFNGCTLVKLHIWNNATYIVTICDADDSLAQYFCTDKDFARKVYTAIIAANGYWKETEYSSLFL